MLARSARGHSGWGDLACSFHGSNGLDKLAQSLVATSSWLSESSRIIATSLSRRLLPRAVETQPRPEDVMEWNGGGVRTGCGDKLALLKVCQCALDRASGEACAGGDRLMR